VTEMLIFWAQALDNASPDHIDMRGEELSPDDTLRRQEAVSLVSGVVKAGSRIFDQRGVQLTEDGRHFVVEVPSAERDRAGRTAPVVCYGEYDSTVGDALGASVAVGLDDFAKRIGRNILPEHFELARESFAELEKVLDEEARARGRDRSGSARPAGTGVLAGLKGLVAKVKGAVQSPPVAAVSTAARPSAREGSAEEFKSMATGSFPSDPSSRKCHRDDDCDDDYGRRSLHAIVLDQAAEESVLVVVALVRVHVISFRMYTGRDGPRSCS